MSRTLKQTLTSTDLALFALGTLMVIFGVLNGLRGDYDRGTFQLILGWFTIWLGRL